MAWSSYSFSRTPATTSLGMSSPNRPFHEEGGAGSVPFHHRPRSMPAGLSRSDTGTSGPSARLQHSNGRAERPARFQFRTCRHASDGPETVAPERVPTMRCDLAPTARFPMIGRSPPSFTTSMRDLCGLSCSASPTTDRRQACPRHASPGATWSQITTVAARTQRRQSVVDIRCPEVKRASPPHLLSRPRSNTAATRQADRSQPSSLHSLVGADLLVAPL